MKIKKRRSLLPALVLLLSCAAAPMTDPIMDSAGAVGEAGVSRIAAVLRNRGPFAVRYEEKWQLERYDEEEGIFVMAPYEEIQYKEPIYFPLILTEMGPGVTTPFGALLFGPRLFAPRMCPVKNFG